MLLSHFAMNSYHDLVTAPCLATIATEAENQLSLPLILLLVVLGVVASYFVWVFVSTLRASATPNNSIKPPNAVLGVSLVATFFDTLGVGSFAPTTAIFRRWQLVPDKELPGTLNVGYSLSTILAAFIYIKGVKVDPLTLISMITAAVAGAWLGAGFVSKLPERKIQLGMGLALISAAAFMIPPLLGSGPTGGDASGLDGWKLVVAIIANFVLGSLMTIGVGLFAPCMVIVYLLGMHADSAFPIMMGSCAFLMPISGLQFLKNESYSPSASLGMSLTGIPAVLIATFVLTSMPLMLLKWLVVAAVTYAGIGLLLEAIPTNAIERVCNWFLVRSSLNGFKYPAWNPIETANAKFAYNIRERRAVYRILDCIGLYLRFRSVPRECALEDCAPHAPTIRDGNDEEASKSVEIWKLYFNEAAGLVKHDDSLNWQKFHYLLGVVTILGGAIGFLQTDSGGSPLLRLILCTIGILLAWGADLTFQEGLRCLRAHRRELKALDQAGPPRGESFLLRQNAYNQRDVLELGPLVMAALFIGLFLFTVTEFFQSPCQPKVGASSSVTILQSTEKASFECSSGAIPLGARHQLQNKMAFSKKPWGTSPPTILNRGNHDDCLCDWKWTCWIGNS